MDIRNFFGGGNKGSSKPAAATKTSSPAKVEKVEPGPPKKRKNVIDDDDDDETDMKVETKEADKKETEKENLTASKATGITQSSSSSSSSTSSSSSSSSTSCTTTKPSSSSNSSTSTAAAVEITTTTVGSIPKELESIITWKHGESVPFLALVDTFEAVSNVSGRLEKEGLFSRFFRAVILTKPEDLEAIVYLASNAVAPAYEGLELGIGDALLVKAICESTGRNKNAVDEDYRREGDLGAVALASRASQKTLSFTAKPKPLSASYVLEQFRLITKTKGDKSQQRKIDIIKSMMIRCQGNEAKYIVRSLQGKLRIGTASTTVLVSLAQAFSQTKTPQVLQMMASDNVKVDVEDDGDNDKNDKNDNDDDDDDDMVIGNDGDEVKDAKDDKVKNKGDDDGQGGVTGVNGDGSAAKEGNAKTSDSNSNGAAVTETMELAESHPSNQAANEKLAEMISAIQQKEAPEAKKLRTAQHLSKDARNELSVAAVKRAFSECPSLSVLVHALLTRPLYQLSHSCHLVPGVPISPMLAKPTKAIGEVLNRLKDMAFTMEYKYDGERAQVHLLEDGTVKIFSRNSLDDSQKYPDLTDIIKRVRRDIITSCVIDCEVVAFDREKGSLLPFQVLSTRKRKVEEGTVEDQKVKVCLEAFDMLYVNGKSLLQEPLRKRRDLLRASFTEEVGYFFFASGADHVENGDSSPIEAYLQEACSSMCEGLMVKTLDVNASYEPSKRSLNWLKLKKGKSCVCVCVFIEYIIICSHYCFYYVNDETYISTHLT